MRIRKKVATLMFVACALTSTLVPTVLAGSASADHSDWHLNTHKHSIVGQSWGGEWHMETYAHMYKWGDKGDVRVTTGLWTTGWVGFHGCLRVTLYDSYGRALKSLLQRAGTTGVFGDVRTTSMQTYIDVSLSNQVQRLGIEHWYCPQ